MPDAKDTPRRAALARELDAAFSGCEHWTVVGPRRREAAGQPRAADPIALAQAEHIALTDARRVSGR